jgi:hypothetical protein
VQIVLQEGETSSNLVGQAERGEEAKGH